MIDIATTATVVFLLLFFLLAIGLWVPIAMIAASLVALILFTSVPAGSVLATSIWGASTEWSLAALPLFIWMGEILYRSRISDDLFNGLAPWLDRLPGRLLHVNVLGSGLFAAVSGSSAATCATIGKMSLPELRSRGYPEDVMVGSLAGSSTLGFLIPPSIILIVYGVAVEESIARLFLAGVVPGALMLLLFMGYVGIWATLNASKMPAAQPRLNFASKLRASARLLPVIVLIFGVIGSIYAGLASPTDAAAVGVVIAVLLSWLRGDLTRTNFVSGLMSSVQTSCMILTIVVCASFLTATMGYLGIPRDLAAWVGGLELDRGSLLLALTIVFVLLGCFMDGISIILLTAAVVLPIVEQAGINLIWFGIYLVLVVEISQITPPIGFNLFVLQSLTGRDILKIAKAALPFFCVMLLGLLLISVIPEIVTWLPTLATAR
ncbi:MAG: TRAP transporter large permease subunit [Pseudomonadota bacterium]